MVQDLGSGVLDAFKRFATTPLKVAVAGSNNKSLVDDVESLRESLNSISHVEVEIGNPLAQTATGRIQIAKDLMSQPHQDARAVPRGAGDGPARAADGILSAELLLIRNENESLKKGETPVVVDLDAHLLHCKEHRSVLASPEARKDPKIVNAVLSHIDEHEAAYFSTDPKTLFMVGQPPPPMDLLPPPPGAPGMPPGAPPGAPGGPPPGPGPGGPPPPKPPGPHGNPTAGAAP
jgi:hypothetical protein